MYPSCVESHHLRRRDLRVTIPQASNERQVKSPLKFLISQAGDDSIVDSQLRATWHESRSTDN